MNKEELKQEAEEKYNERLKQNGIKVEYRNGTYVDGYMDSAEPRETRIAELETQIEKMKCCANCKKYWCMCEYGDREMQICEKWEIKEK